MFHAVDHAVTHSRDLRKADLLFKPVDQKINCRIVIANLDVNTALLTTGRIAENQLRTGYSDAINFSGQSSFQ